MKIVSQVEILQPPDQLSEGFLGFAKEVHQKHIDKGIKFSLEELTDFFTNSFPGRIRANFLLWIKDLNNFILPAVGVLTNR